MYLGDFKNTSINKYFLCHGDEGSVCFSDVFPHYVRRLTSLNSFTECFLTNLIAT